MCTDRHGIFNYLRIQSEFRARCRALCSRLLLFRSSSMRRVFARFCLPLFYVPPVSRPFLFSRFAHLSRNVALSAFGTFGVTKAHARRDATRRFACRRAGNSCPLFVVARADAIAPVARLQRYRTHAQWRAPDKKRLTGAVLPSVRQSTSEFFGSFTVVCIAPLPPRWRHRDRRSKGIRFDFRESRRETLSCNLTLKCPYSFSPFAF